MPIPIVDGIVVLVVLISSVLAMVRGFVREVLAVAAWIAAAACAYAFYKPLLPLISPYISNVTVASVGAAAAVFFVALIVASFITMKIADFVVDSRIGMLDRLLGLAFGAARGVLLLVVALGFFDVLVQPTPPWMAAAYTRAPLEQIGQRLVDSMPKDLADQITQRWNHLTGKGAAVVPDDAAAKAQAGYGNSDRQRLDQVIQNGAGAK